MGVDVKLFVNPKYDEHDVVDALEKMGETGVEIDGKHCMGTYTKIRFTSHLYDDLTSRTIWFHANAGEESLGLPANLLSLHSDEESIEVLEKLAKTFGGILQRRDCEEEYETFQPCVDAEHLHNRFITAMGEDMPRNFKEMKEEFIKFLQEYE